MPITAEDMKPEQVDMREKVEMLQQDLHDLTYGARTVKSGLINYLDEPDLRACEPIKLAVYEAVNRITEAIASLDALQETFSRQSRRE